MKIYQAYSGPFQEAQLSCAAIPYDYTGNGGTEYEIFKCVASQIANVDEPWGVLSWKFKLKTKMAVEKFKVIAEDAFSRGYDCVCINPMLAAEALCSNVWEQGVIYGHTGMDKIVEYLVRARYLEASDFYMCRDTFALCNYFIASNTFWSRYFEFVDNIIFDLEGEAISGTEAGVAYAGSAAYVRNRALSMKPFVVERLFSTFVPKSGLRVANVKVGLDQYIQKFGGLLGEVVYGLSNMKNGLESSGSGKSWRVLANNMIASHHLSVLMQLDDPESGLLSLRNSILTPEELVGGY